ncbi:hypothetical protein Hypma_006142 [Hypsizygus marmoreus]|uniref:Uncharacterized protein n=1 Tax=Hypsizygus marmoreus TaxID=39966 RepID=A0A369JTJ9_HYPMA|nr:hypothetical protein Hypma_006142 [Hypsizygus marmoreus]
MASTQMIAPFCDLPLTPHAFRDYSDILPVEVLAEIFLLSLPKDTRPHPQEAPLVLCHVNSFWRRTAIGTPRLWQTLCLHIPHIHCALLQNLAELIGFWFVNAAPHTVSFSLRDQGSALTRPDLDTLIPFVHRFHEFRLFTFRGLMPLTAFDAPGEHFRSLEALELNIDYQHWALPQPRRHIFHTAPSLRRLCICGPNILEYLVFPWSQLTSLTIERDLHPSVWRTIFSQCTNLEFGSFGIDQGWEASSEARRETDFSPHDKLEILKLRNEIDTNISFLDNFAFPNLHTFSLAAYVYQVPELLATHDIFGQLHHSNTLRHLVLVKVNIELLNLLSLVTSIPALEKIALDIAEFDYKTFFDALYASARERRSLSALTAFALCGSGVLDRAIPSFIRLIHSLRGDEQFGRLKEVSLFVWDCGDLGYALRSSVRITTCLNDWAHSEVACLDGFTMTTGIAGEDFDIASAIHV